MPYFLPQSLLSYHENIARFEETLQALPFTNVQTPITGSIHYQDSVLEVDVDNAGLF